MIRSTQSQPVAERVRLTGLLDRRGRALGYFGLRDMLGDFFTTSPNLLIDWNTVIS